MVSLPNSIPAVPSVPTVDASTSSVVSMVDTPTSPVADASSSSVVVPSTPGVFTIVSVVPYSGSYKECASLSLSRAGITKPDYCCNNTDPGLLKFGARYTVTFVDGTVKDVCAQCAANYEANQ